MTIYIQCYICSKYLLMGYCTEYSPIPKEIFMGGCKKQEIKPRLYQAWGDTKYNTKCGASFQCYVCTKYLSDRHCTEFRDDQIPLEILESDCPYLDLKPEFKRLDSNDLVEEKK